MKDTITAIYEGGVLRPLRPLRLPENTRVQLRLIKPSKEPSAGDVIRALLSTGRVGHLTTALISEPAEPATRQPPPSLPGPSLGEIIVAQRRGEM